METNESPVQPRTGDIEKLQAQDVQHGVNCRKVAHDLTQTGYLHNSNDDSPYDVDGVIYCGRCHHAL